MSLFLIKFRMFIGFGGFHKTTVSCCPSCEHQWSWSLLSLRKAFGSLPCLGVDSKSSGHHFWFHVGQVDGSFEPWIHGFHTEKATSGSFVADPPEQILHVLASGPQLFLFVVDYFPGSRCFYPDSPPFETEGARWSFSI